MMRLQFILFAITVAAPSILSEPLGIENLRGFDLINYTSEYNTKRKSSGNTEPHFKGIQNLNSIQNELTSDNQTTKRGLIDCFHEHYENTPQECLKKLRMILNEELGSLSSLVQQVLMYLANHDVIKDDMHLIEIQNFLSDLIQSIEQSKHALPSPATLEKILQIGFELSQYCDAINEFLNSNFSTNFYIPETPDISHLECNIENAATLLVSNAYYLSYIEPIIQNIHLTWFNKAYRSLCNAGNKLPEGTFSLTSALAVSGTSLIGLYCLPPAYAEKIGVRGIQRKLFGPYLDENVPEEKKIIDTLRQQLATPGQSSAQHATSAQEQNFMNSIFPRQQVPQQHPSASQPNQEQSMLNIQFSGIINDVAYSSQYNETAPLEEFNKRYTQPYTLSILGSSIFSGYTALAKVAGDHLFSMNQFAQLNSHLGGVYNKISEQVLAAHNFLKGAVPENTRKLEYIENITLDDPRFDAIRDSLDSLYQIVDYMRNPYKYTHGGLSAPHSVLITGPSGSGKTFLAHALAGSLNQELQDNAHFYDLEKTDWAHIKSLGARNAVEAIFEDAKRYAPTIIFIDEAHNYDLQDNTNSTFLAELLKELDKNDLNKNPDEQVFVIAATNRPEKLDGALLRDARFGDRITLSNPGFEQRKAILQTRCDQLKIDTKHIDFDYLASLTAGAPLSTLEKLFEDAIFFARRDNMQVTFAHFYLALNRKVRKISPVCSLQEHEQRIIASNIATQGIIQYYHDPDKLDALTLCSIDKNITEVNAIFDRTSSEQNVNSHQVDYGHIFTRNMYEQIASHNTAAQRQECKQLLAGKRGEELIAGVQSSYRSGDITQAFQKAIDIVCNGVPFKELSEAKQNEKRDEAHNLFLQIQKEAEEEVNKHYDEIVRLRDKLVQEYFLHKPAIENAIYNIDDNQLCSDA